MACNNTYALEEINLIAGDFTPIQFTVFDEDISEFANLSGYEVFMVICQFGNPSNVILKKEGIKLNNGEFGEYRVELLSNETIHLGGKYVYQPLLVYNDSKQYRPAQGILTIMPANN